MNKKAALGIIMTITIILITMLIIYGITAKFFRSVDTGLQDSICRANIIGAAQAKTGEASGYLGAVWESTKKTTLEQAQNNPLCTTKTHTIDVSGDDAKSQIAKVGRDLGELTENCWKTFGEGKIPNTFGQNQVDADVADIINIINPATNLPYDFRTYYFSCYKFKIVDEDISTVIPTSEISGDSGVWWKLNVRGENLYDAKGNFVKGGVGKFSSDIVNVPLSDFQKQKNKDEYDMTKSSKNLPYSGFILWKGNGYYEFVTDVKKTNLVKSFFGRDTVYPQSEPETILEELSVGEWYEIRYYSPWVKDGPSNIVLNNIKIMPAGASGGTKVIPIMVS